MAEGAPLVAPDRAFLGSVAWVRRCGGHLSFGERLRLLGGTLPGLLEGYALGRRARREGRTDIAVARLEPPETPMVKAARAYLEAHVCRPMIHHSFRTGYWTAAVLHQHDSGGEKEIETAWVAALLHDVGLEVPPARGDFTMGGVEVLERLAREVGWSGEQTEQAAEAIVSNIGTRVDRRRSGVVAWAMNVGGAGEVGVWLHRAQLHSDRILEIERRYPRDDFRSAATRLIRDESRRVPGGRFAVLGPVFRLLMKD
jgi:hypothetical protein